MGTIKENRKPVYLTTRLLASLSRKAFKAAAAESMEVMGYIVIAQDGWIVKKFKDGQIEKIEKLNQHHGAFPLD